MSLPVFLFALLAPLFPACPTEDSTLCHWAAEERGNGRGVAFVALSDSFLIYRGQAPGGF